jgi:hypothetical protein
MQSKCFRVTVVPCWQRKPTGSFAPPALTMRFPWWRALKASRAATARRRLAEYGRDDDHTN